MNENMDYMNTHFKKDFKMLREETPVNAVGFGNVAGVSPGEDPPGGLPLFDRHGNKKKKKKKIKGLKDFQEAVETITQADFVEIEKFADRLFAKVGIDVEFTKHFKERVNDKRNRKPVTKSELIRFFRQAFKRHSKKIGNMKGDQQAVLNDLVTDLNLPFVINFDPRNKESEMVTKTIMRKKNFKTPNKKLTFEQIDELVVAKPDPSETLGIPRSKMPQVKLKHYPELFEFLTDNGVEFTTERVPAKSLKAVQKEFSDDGVTQSMEKSLQGAKEKPLIASKEGFIIDGHHRWLAVMNKDANKNIAIIRTNKGVRDLLKLVLKFPKTIFKNIK
jgi:hypothetical protein